LEAQTDIQTYLERGRQALAQGQGRDAAIAYAHAAQLEPNNPVVHLGLAEANLALGNYGVVYMACRKVQELQPAGGPESIMAQALLNLLDRRYDRALQDVDTYIMQDPANGYAHALRAYLLRATGQNYDAGLARARASRLSQGYTFENSFPPLESAPGAGYSGYAGDISGDSPTFVTDQPNDVRREAIPTWSRPNQMQRRVTRTRFMLSQNPRFVTSILIGINLVIYAVLAILSKNIVSIDENVLLNAGAQYNVLVAQGQIWRIFTAMFLHFSIIHIGLNMLSLFFIGTAVEVFYGKWRYLLIYLASGIVGGIVTFVLQPNAFAAGASGAIFGVFGALGAFYFTNRRALGQFGSGAIGNWLFWLGLNLIWGFSNPNIGILDHLGGLVAGLILGLILVRRLGPRRM